MTTQLTTIASSLDAYIQSTFMLVRSLVIKSSISASRLNDSIVSKYGDESVDVDRPWTWKYYMNISGQYHFTDTMMKVISLDTQEEIDFTVKNMRAHTATAEAYRYGTRYYLSLVRLYPDQEQLILAVNNPANIHKAIEAEDGSILAYYRDYVEPQENTLIYDLEQYIKGYLSRYTVIGFNNIWKNYPVVNLANLYGSLAAQIMNIRLLACKTEKTHSFHIEQYLASHGHLDKYIPYMTLKQKLYLYHNIDFINKYAGHTSTFEELIQWILTDRRIPLASYTVRQLQEHDAQSYPLIRAHRTPLGTEENTTEAEYVDLEVFYSKEKQTQLGNPDYYEYHEKDITHSLQTSDSSVIQTKDLESSMVDYTDAVADPLPEVLLKQWAYMSAKGMYKVLVNFNHPTTGERVSLLAKDALIYYSYLMMTAMGYRPTEIPSFLNVKFRLHPRPPVELLYRDLVPSMFPDLKGIADELVKAQPKIVTCRSVSSFWDLTYKIYQENLKHWYLKANTHDPLKRGIVAKMVSRLFGIEDLVLDDTGRNMETWLNDNDLPVFEGTAQEALLLCNIIFQKATGYTVDETKSLRSIQKAMINLFKQLSSYSIQVMREINDSAIIPLNWAAIRIGFRGQESEDQVNIKSFIRVQGISQTSTDFRYVSDNGDHVNAVIEAVPHDVHVHDGVDVKLCDTLGQSYVIDAYVNIPATRVYDDSPGAGKQSDPFQPMTYYNALSERELETIANFITSRQ